MFTIPNKGVGDSNFQSVLTNQDIEVLVAGISGVDCVLSGLAVTGGADMTPAVAKGAVLTNRIMKAVAAADVTIGTADATNPRIDLIVVNSSGALAVRAGTAAAVPLPPARSTNDVVIAMVYVPAADTTIETTKCIDKRVMPPLPLCIYRTTAAETTNTTAAAIHILDKTNSGVVIPNGLLTTGRMLRVRIWGSILMNSGTPTNVLTIAYGAFVLDFMLVAQGNADQALTGFMSIGDFSTAVTAPTTGYGDAFPVAGSMEPSPTFGGAGTADSDAANRTLTVTWTFNVSNAANEMTVEGATVELL
jgi:hypothetical protein